MGDMFCANGSNTKYIDHLPRYVLEPFKWHLIKGKLSDSFTNYNYVGNTKVSVSIKKLKPTNAH